MHRSSAGVLADNPILARREGVLSERTEKVRPLTVHGHTNQSNAEHLVFLESTLIRVGTTPAPILVSVYTRLETFRTCVAALTSNPLASQSRLYVVSDAASRPEDVEKVGKVRDFVREISGFEAVVPLFNSTNKGGFASITSAEKAILADHKRIIVLEDDVIASPGFLDFMNEGLERLAARQDVFSVCGYVPPDAYGFSVPGKAMRASFHCPWGYATWHDRYHSIDSSRNPYPDVLRSPATIGLITENCPFMLEVLREDYLRDMGCADVRISFQMLLKGMFSVYPPISLTRNIGFDGSGQRMKASARLMEQEIADEARLSDWSLQEHAPFERAFLRNGRVHKQRAISMLYRLGLRDRLDWLVNLARSVRR